MSYLKIDPLYTTISIPEFLDITWFNILRLQFAHLQNTDKEIIIDRGKLLNDWKENKLEDDFVNFIEKMRLFFLNNYEKNNTPPAGVNKTKKKVIQKFREFNEEDASKVYDFFDDSHFLKSTYHGGNVVNQWFPERFDTDLFHHGKNMGSVIDMFRDKQEFLKHSIDLILLDRMHLWSSRKTLARGKIYSLVLDLEGTNRKLFPKYKQVMRIGGKSIPSTSFSPLVAKFLYQKSLLLWTDISEDDDNIFILEPYAKWGGRLVGLFAAINHKKFHNKVITLFSYGTNTKTEKRYEMLRRFWQKNINPFLNIKFNHSVMAVEHTKFSLLHLHPDWRGKGSVIVSSPPIYGKDLYGGEFSKHKEYKTYREWKNGFLPLYMDLCYSFLKKGGLFFMHTCDIKIDRHGKYFPIHKDSVKKALKKGFVVEKIFNMLYKVHYGSDKNKRPINANNIVFYRNKWVKSEPVYMFRKK